MKINSSKEKLQMKKRMQSQGKHRIVPLRQKRIRGLQTDNSTIFFMIQFLNRYENAMEKDMSFKSLIDNLARWQIRLQRSFQKALKMFLNKDCPIEENRLIQQDFLSVENDNKRVLQKIQKFLQKHQNQRLQKQASKLDKYQQKYAFMEKILIQNYFKILKKFFLDRRKFQKFQSIYEMNQNIQKKIKSFNMDFYPNNLFKTPIFVQLKSILHKMASKDIEIHFLFEQLESLIINSNDQRVQRSFIIITRFNNIINKHFFKTTQINKYLTQLQKNQDNLNLIEGIKLKEYIAKMGELCVKQKQVMNQSLKYIANEQIIFLSQNMQISKSLNRKSNEIFAVISLLKSVIPKLNDDLNSLIDSLIPIYGKIQNNLKMIRNMPQDATKKLEVKKQIEALSQQYKISVKDLIEKYYEIYKVKGWKPKQDQKKNLNSDINRDLNRDQNRDQNSDQNRDQNRDQSRDQNRNQNRAYENQQNLKEYNYFIRKIEKRINEKLQTQIRTPIEQISKDLQKQQNNEGCNLSHWSKNKVNNIQNIIDKLYINMNIESVTIQKSQQIKRYYLNKIKAKFIEKDQIGEKIIQRATKNYQNHVSINSSMQNELYTTQTNQLIQNYNIQNANELRRYIFTEVQKLNAEESAKIFW